MSKYNKIRDKVKTGDCILVKGKGPISRFIQLWTKYSHCYMVVRPNTYEGLEDRVFLLDSTYYGVRLVLLSNLIDNYNGQIDLFQVHGMKKETEEKILVDAIIASASQIKYDYFGLFKNIIGRTNLTLQRYFCSELIWAKWIKSNHIYLGAKTLTEHGTVKLMKGIAPRPGDIPKWVKGNLTTNINGR